MAKKVTERVIEIDAKGAENSIRSLREEVRKLTEVQRDLDMESEEFREISSELTAAQTRLRNAVQGNTAAVEGSYKAYSHQLQVLKEHRKWLAEGTEEYRKTTEEISKLDQKLKDMDAEIGVYSRNVGNYASAFEGLNGGVQQVAQGIPQLVNGSQNLFGIARSSIPTILKSAESIGEVSNQGGKAKAVISALTKSIFSWQTLLVGGIALLSEYGGKIVDWVSGLFKAKNAVVEVNKGQKEFNEAISEGVKSVGEDIYLVKQLSEEWRALGDDLEARKAFIEENTSAFDSLGVSVTNVKDAERLFIEQTPKFIESLKARARAEAARKYAEEKYAEVVAADVAIQLGDASVTVGGRSQAEMDANYRALQAWQGERAKLEQQRNEAEKWANEAFAYASALSDEVVTMMNEVGVAPAPSKPSAGSGSGTTTPRSGSTKKRFTVDNAISTLGAYSNRGIGITALGTLAIDEGASIEANKARLAALTQMEGASAEERKAIEQSLQDELAFIEQMRLETHEMVLNEMLRSDELTADERIALEEELTANQVAQAELRAKAAEEQAKAEKKAAEEVMAIEKKKDELKQQILKNSSSMLKDFASTLEDNTAEYKSIQSAAVVIDTIAAGMAGYKQGMTYGGPAAPFLAAFNLATAIATGAAQLHALWAVKPDGSNADSALSSAQVPNVASSMPASYTRNLMGDNELSELNKDTRVYVVEQDITDTQKKAKTREESASF